ncbi:peptidase inhibitor family I36 protein [Kribbella italica]|uniref:Peptidase inhibitor family I36 n=1 Tax=Kribbella italica TaxID=1540520 RepID=A0A7W9JAX0_9ACTN|nr:peptidase inhibitor family I36 protein [Kribbella italica]MBB5838778.1 hypothetical protein [Kribbella italica]
MRGVRKATLSTVAGLLVATGGLVAATQPAAASRTDCPANRICIWHNQNFTPTAIPYVKNEPHLGSNSDEAHSVYNNGSVAWLLHDDDNYSRSDTFFCIRAGQYTSDLGQPAYKFGDKITSISKLPNNNCPSGAKVL